MCCFSHSLTGHVEGNCSHKQKHFISNKAPINLTKRLRWRIILLFFLEVNFVKIQPKKGFICEASLTDISSVCVKEKLSQCKQKTEPHSCWVVLCRCSCSVKTRVPFQSLWSRFWFMVDVTTPMLFVLAVTVFTSLHFDDEEPQRVTGWLLSSCFWFFGSEQEVYQSCSWPVSAPPLLYKIVD